MNCDTFLDVHEDYRYVVPIKLALSANSIEVIETPFYMHYDAFLGSSCGWLLPVCRPYVNNLLRGLGVGQFQTCSN